MQKFKIIVFIAFISLLTACGNKNKDDEARNATEQSVYETAQKHLNRSNWSAAANSLQLLEENFPFGNYAEQAQLELIYAYYRMNDYDLAIASADRFIRLHPQHRNVDYAYYMRGIASFYNKSAITTALISEVSNRDSGSAKESFNYFSQLLEKFPESIYVLDAQQRMIYLRNNLARYEIHIANYYFKRGAYVAAANRGRFVVENMQGTPAVPDALAVMAQAYHLINMPDLATDAAKVLAHNFPEYPALKKSGEFNFKYNLEKSRSFIGYLTLGLFEKRPTFKFDTRSIYNPQFQTEISQSSASEPPES